MSDTAIADAAGRAGIAVSPLSSFRIEPADEGGLVVGYAMLKGARVHPMAELKYRYLKWRINRVRKKFDVYSGGRADDWDRRVH